MKTNDQGHYEVEVTFRLTLDPAWYGYDATEPDLALVALSRMRGNLHGAEVEIVER